MDGVFAKAMRVLVSEILEFELPHLMDGVFACLIQQQRGFFNRPASVLASRYPIPKVIFSKNQKYGSIIISFQKRSILSEFFQSAGITRTYPVFSVNRIFSKLCLLNPIVHRSGKKFD